MSDCDTDQLRPCSLSRHQRSASHYSTSQAICFQLQFERRHPRRSGVPNDRAYLTSEHTITSVHTLTSVHTFSHYLCSLVEVCSLVESEVKIEQKSMHTRYSMHTR